MLMQGAPPGASDQRFIDVTGMPMGTPMVPGRQMPGMGYDQYIPMIRERIRRKPMPGLRLPSAPPRFPTPGRMDGMREAKPKMPRGMMGIGMGGAMMPPMMGML
jgi:hypothetical protein